MIAFILRKREVMKSDLEESVAKIAREDEFEDIKPYSHNIASLA